MPRPSRSSARDEIRAPSSTAGGLSSWPAGISARTRFASTGRSFARKVATRPAQLASRNATPVAKPASFPCRASDSATPTANAATCGWLTRTALTLSELLRPVLERDEGEELPADVLAGQVTVDQGGDGLGGEAERRDQRSGLELRANAFGGGLPEPAIDGDLESALRPARDSGPQLRLQESAHESLVADG